MGPPAEPIEIKSFESLCPANDSTEYDIPTLEQIGLSISDVGMKARGGEEEGLKRLEEKLSDKKWVCQFEKPMTSPNSLEPSTTLLSPYLKFGCVSARLFYHKLVKIYKQ